MVFGMKMPIVEVERGRRGDFFKKSDSTELDNQHRSEVVGSKDSRRRFTGRYPDLWTVQQMGNFTLY